MQLSTTFRHMDASQAVRDYAEERLSRIKKYFTHRDPIASHATFSVERNHHHTAELSITLPNGLVVLARETTEDMYSSIDLAWARIERQVRRWKDRIRDHKPHHGPSFSARQSVLAEHIGDLSDGAPARKAGKAKAGKSKAKGPTAVEARVPSPPPAPSYKVIVEQTFTVRSMRADDAIMQMNLLEADFFVFNDVDSHAVSVVYRRKDGHYGLIETGRSASGDAGKTATKAGKSDRGERTEKTESMG